MIGDTVSIVVPVPTTAPESDSGINLGRVIFSGSRSSAYPWALSGPKSENIGSSSGTLTV